ncbi:MAG TPA: pyridoxal phosphate-dependent aminotransferase [Candidatus Marinimicrobia bacterium]|nr:pyridoxal phosphate-dependent aminotransferase [Candidatus Neomarinimicrobiota bacterium]
MPISKKISESLTRSSWIRKMFETGIVLKQKYGEENVYDFSLGNPDLKSPDEFSKALIREASKVGDTLHGYMPNAGYPETRRCIAEMLAQESGLPFSEEHVIMTCGAAGALNVILKSILDPGDEVVVIAPYFAEYNFYIDNHQGVRVISQSSDDLLPDLVDLAQKITSRTKAVIINTPNNPSGRVYSEKLLKELGALLRDKSSEFRHPVYLLADEPYKKIIFTGGEYHSPLRYYRHTILATSFSKDLSIAGERIGYLAVSPLIEDADAIINAATFCNRILGYINAPALMQRVVKHALDAEVDVAVYQQRRDLMCDGLTAIGYELIKPEGTFYVFPKSPASDDVAFVQALQKHLILTTPGSGFQCPGYFRIALCVPEETIIKSLAGFEQTYREMVN